MIERHFDPKACIFARDNLGNMTKYTNAPSEDLNYSRRRLLTFFVPGAALIRGRRLIEGGAYSSKYGTHYAIAFTVNSLASKSAIKCTKRL